MSEWISTKSKLPPYDTDVLVLIQLPCYIEYKTKNSDKYVTTGYISSRYQLQGKVWFYYLKLTQKTIKSFIYKKEMSQVDKTVLQFICRDRVVRAPYSVHTRVLHNKQDCSHLIPKVIGWQKLILELPPPKQIFKHNILDLDE